MTLPGNHGTSDHRDVSGRAQASRLDVFTIVGQIIVILAWVAVSVGLNHSLHGPPDHNLMLGALIAAVLLWTAFGVSRRRASRRYQ